MQKSRSFSASAENVAAARRFVSEVAERWKLGDLAWPLVQIVSELASNAVIHAGTTFTVRLIRDREATRIEVLDASVRRARSRDYGVDATTGRGLHLVESLSREWGVSKADEGKVVWAVVDGAALDDGDPEAFLEAFLDGDDLGEAKHVSAKPAKGRGATRSRAHLQLAA